MSIFEDSNTLVFVSTITNAYADTNVWTAAGQPAGSVVFVKTEDNTVEEGALVAATEYRVIAKTTAGVLHFSPPFLGSQVKNAMGMDQEALVEQVTYLGYNGVSGSMDAANNTYYGLGIVLNHTFGMLNNSPLMLTIPYKSGGAATQSEVAAGLAIEATNVLKRQAYKPFKVERINSGAQLVDLNNFNLLNGSKYFTSADDDTLVLLVGSIIRVEEPENNGDEVTDPVYIIVGHDSGVGAARVYELDQPFQGVTNADHDHVSTIVEGDWGLKFTGVSVADAAFNPITDEPFVVSFELMTRDFVTATVTNPTTGVPTIGSGTYQLCSQMEVYSQFQRSGKELSAYPPTPKTRLIQTTATNLYHVYSFEIWNNSFTDATTGIKPVSPSRIVIIEDDALTENFNTVLGVTLVTAVI